mgnify:FL=1
MASYHFIGGDGKTYGPYPLEKLQEFQSQNRLDGETKVQKDGGEFQPASEFPELMATGVPPTQQATPHPQPQYGTPQPGAPYYAQPVYDPNAKPGKVQAIAIMTLVGGIMATLGAVWWALFTLCIWIPFIYGLVFGIMAIVKGSKLLGANPWPEYLTVKTTAIMGIVNIINCDIVNMTMGIIILVFLNDPQVRAYMRLPVK